MIVVLRVPTNDGGKLLDQYKGHGYASEQVHRASVLASVMKQALSTEEERVLQQMADASGVSIAEYLVLTVKQSVAKREVFNYRPKVSS